VTLAYAHLGRTRRACRVAQCGAARLGAANSGDGITFTVFAADDHWGRGAAGGAGSLWGVLGGVVLLSSIDNVLNLTAINPLYVTSCAAWSSCRRWC
jgi:ribose/xylose/arabinose/galactoside ABC-type transport system permease subunit